MICTFDGLLDNQPPLKQDQGIIMGVDVHVYGSFKRFQDPGFGGKFERKSSEISLWVELRICARSVICPHLSARPVKKKNYNGNICNSVLLDLLKPVAQVGRGKDQAVAGESGGGVEGLKV